MNTHLGERCVVCEDTDTVGRWPCEDGDRDWVATGQGILGATTQNWKRQGKIFL